MNEYPYKPTPTEFPVHELITKRWSAVAFSSEKVEEEKIMSLFEAMRWAPNSRNEQPWRMVYATRDDASAFEKLELLLDDGNQYARQAYFLGVICAVKRFKLNNKENAHHWYDAGSAVENFFLQAVSMDLICHVMSGFDRVRAAQDLGIPTDDVSVIAMVAVGYPGDPAQLDEKKKATHEAARTRNAISDFAFEGHWR